MQCELTKLQSNFVLMDTKGIKYNTKRISN